MDAILPFKIKNEQQFFESALKVGYNEMEIIKFIYVVQQSDMDIFPKMHDERINILLYGWELCEDYKHKLNPKEWELPEEMETVLKHLVSWSMDIWFSKEWDKCRYLLKTALIHCLNRARDLLMRMPDMMQINWDFLLLYNLKPWNVLYLKNINVSKQKTIENGAQSIETEEMPATDEDISYVKLEQLPIIVLRLVKLFDQSSIDMVKTLCMRVITAWNKIHQTELETSGSRRPYIPPEDKRCLMLICHIYLMAVYESDDVKGYVIDNMINNIRFYYQGFQNSSHGMDNLEYTPARYIALTNIHLRVQKRDFFDFFIWNKYDTSLVNLFGVVSQAYKSYLLGNLLMELNNMNEDDFVTNAPLYKRLMNSYVNEREKSELFLLNELNKIEAQRYAHNIIQTVKNVTDFKSKICKGNRMSNIGNYENSDDTVTPLADTNLDNNNPEIKEDELKEEIVGEDLDDEQERVRVKENELRLDPVFQYLPNNESILYYVYDVLAKKDYVGWHFAKIVLLAKIIGLEQNMIETWRYHPGLTTDFMLNLEVKLSEHYVDLAKIFKDHPFLQQEFWLTAFYLNPTAELYEAIKRLGMRNNRKRTDEHTKLVLSMANVEAKYGLLSSTIDVKDLAVLSNTDDPTTDYDPLFAVLHSLRLPDSLVKDMLTAIFLPRNRSFAWSVDWVILRNRCKMIMNNSKEKKRFVDLNMAEANERLKYLIIDYEKYKNRPQLDYGTIEAGYENLLTSAEFDKVSEEEEDDEEDDFEDDEDVYENKRRGRGTPASGRKKEEEKAEDDNSQEDDPFLMGKRRTRARTAATLASFLFQTLPRTSRRRKNQKALEEEMKKDEDKISGENDDKSSDSNTPLRTSESPIPSLRPDDCDPNDETKSAKVPTKMLKECLRERPAILNTTQGFQNLIDIWNVEKSDLQSIDENCVSLMESSSALQIAVKLKLLNSEINPMGCDEKEYIDDKEMIIHNAEFIIKKESDMEISDYIEEANDLEETLVPMEIDANETIVETFSVDEESAKPEKSHAADDFEVSEKCLLGKVTEHKAAESHQNQTIPPTEENSNESLISDMSTKARKDSGEVSESNTEINSKRNSLNIDIETEYKIIQNQDSNGQNETVTDIKENSVLGLLLPDKQQESNPEIVQDKSSMEKTIESDNINILQKENKAEEEFKMDDEYKAKDGTGAQAEKKDKELPSATEEILLFKIDNKVTQQPKVIDNEVENKDIKTQHLKTTDHSDYSEKSEEVKGKDTERTQMEISKEAKDTSQENKDKETVAPQLENSKLSMETNENKQIEKLELENNDDRNSIKITDKAKDIDNEIENKETELENKILQEPNDMNSESKNRETKINQLRSNEDKISENDNISEKPIDNERCVMQQLKEIAEQTLNEIKENSTSINKEADVQSIDIKESENMEKTNNVEESLSKKNEEISKDESNKSKKKLAEILHKTDNANETGNTANKTDNKEYEENESRVKSLETDTDSKRVSVDINEINNSTEQPPIVSTFEKQYNKHELESTESKVFKAQTGHSESNVTSSEESEEVEKITDQVQRETIESKKDSDAITDKENSERNDYENAINTTIDKKKFESTKCEKEILPTTVKEKSEITDPEKSEITESGKAALATLDAGKLLTSDGENAEDTSSDQTNFEATDAKTFCYSPIVLLDYNSDGSIKFNLDEDNVDSETEHLKNLCLTNNAKILIPKLRSADLKDLRQPKVRLQRVSYEKYRTKFRAKRRCIEGRSYIEYEDSSNSAMSMGTNTSSSEAYHPTKVKRKIAVRRQSFRQVRTSESDNDTNNSDDFKLSTIIANSRKRRLSTPSTSQSSTSQHVTGPKSARRPGRKPGRQKTGPKSSKQNLIVTPRSASGLKLRISNAEQNYEETDPRSKKFRSEICDEIIQLSSSSDECILDDLPTIEEVIEIDPFPLFEEEIII